MHRVYSGSFSEAEVVRVAGSSRYCGNCSYHPSHSHRMDSGVVRGLTRMYGRPDLRFRHLESGKTRLDEVTGSSQIPEAKEYQTVIYHGNWPADEVCVSNARQDIVLTPDFIQAAQKRIQFTRWVLINDPLCAATRYTPHPDNCWICRNLDCPYYPHDRTGSVEKVERR
jgi:hypothetical protein